MVATLGISFLVCLAPGRALAQAEQADSVNNCVACHGVLGDERLSAPVQAFDEDIHSIRGLTCIACHGGDETAPGMIGMDASVGFLGKPSRRDVPEFCGRCHSSATFMRQYNPSLRVDQVTEYQTSVHGRRLMELGDTAVATCLSCHPAHSIKPPSDPLSSVHPLNVSATCGECHANAGYMEAYSIPTDQRDRYEQSVHWDALSVQGDLSAPTCNDCHGNHGAAPPGLSWIGNVCGQCHSVMADLFALSRHAQTFTMLGMPGCATCHQNHEIMPAHDGLLGLDDGAVCVRCHVASDAGGQTAGAMRSLIDSLRGQYDSVHAIVLRAENAGMEVSQALFELNGANDGLVSARAAVHSFDLVRVREAVEEGLSVTADVRAIGDQALHDLQMRRLWLAVLVTIIIGLIVGLLHKIRNMEKAAE